ncbi:DUF4293 domain-containing protein [Niabella drilacis]|uniref:Uncharacterized protein n=1 Tax=Niabella drilacis (strain DSM 25811 / CCM 8410 / CCUG 62505 / LMG 26954 / E90) TaxID=1285928 RepID=A0A1G6S1W6_NIADE|nr:DUF4293 domain-containing protein [Niabella drilacis]SDD10186.1 protein of unknown function [Niabella drilacis]
MIQRKQTLWLLLSVICAGLTFKFPFYNGTVNGTEGVAGADMNAASNIWLTLLTGAVAALGLITIFLYKNRKQQLQLTFLGLIASVGLIALYASYIREFHTGGIAITAILSLLVVVGFFFALKGIRRDQKLIRDLNRLR